MAVWITGLPGSGKSAVSDGLLKERPGLVVLRMDELRRVATPAPTYCEEERDLLYRALVYTAKTVTALGHDVVIDATGNLRRWRTLARETIPRYLEVYLKCPLEVCARRERARTELRSAPRDIYDKGEKGWPVPGVNAPYEEPGHPELTIETSEVGVQEAVQAIHELIGRTGSGSGG